MTRRKTVPPPARPRSYDTVQVEAVLVTCARCHGQWHTTHPLSEWCCRGCRLTADAGAALFRRDDHT